MSTLTNDRHTDSDTQQSPVLEDWRLELAVAFAGLLVGLVLVFLFL
ncbi:MAG: hypothetical protein R3320_03455 [Nitriliruptorales bacterium]|nr:hypothetical protein [Nitriliruptorales bacterium]